MRKIYFEQKQKFLKIQKTIIMHEKVINYGTTKLNSFAHQKTLLGK